MPPDDALGCRPSVTIAASGPNPMLRCQLPVTEGGGVHPLGGGNIAVTLGASPANKSAVALSSLASLIPSDSSRDVYLQRVQVDADISVLCCCSCGFNLCLYHRLRGSASPVVKVTSHFNGKLQNLTPRISKTP